ncbi:MAG: DNA polymerase V [Candidatus Azotimanducaceae bacterium]|jgi:DNA polymerase V
MSETIIADIAKAEINERQKAPLFASSPSAGFPAPADDLVEKALDINDLVVENPASTFFVRVQGDSMEGAGIFSGDVLVVDKSVEARDGKIVVAAVYGEMVVKRLKKVGDTHMLYSENDSYEPIAVNENEDCYIWGVVVGSVRTFA